LESPVISVAFSDEYFPRNGGRLEDLQPFKSLVVDAGGHLEYLKCVPEKMQTLSFRLWSSIKVLTPFTSLRTLSIASFPNVGVNHMADLVITFPLLECLTLQVWVVDPAMELAKKIRAPLLITLRLLDHKARLSVADAATFHHIRALELLSSWFNPVGIVEILAAHLHKYTMLTSLIVCPWHLHDVMQQLSNLRIKAEYLWAWTSCTPSFQTGMELH
jgi:hypothetical protein